MVLYDGGKILAKLAAGSILGFLYVLLLPFAWMVAAAVIIMKRIVGALTGTAAESTSFNWRPSETYLTGKKENKEADSVKPGQDDNKQ